MWYVGLDVHQRRSTFRVLYDHSVRLKKRTINGSWDTVLKELRAIKQPFRICRAAGRESGRHSIGTGPKQMDRLYHYKYHHP
jgi:hypothetical protein